MKPRTPTVADVDATLADMSTSMLEQYAAAYTPQALGSLSWEALNDAQRRAMRAANMLATRAYHQRQVANDEAERNRIVARQQREDEAQREVMLNVYRASGGHPDDFEHWYTQQRQHTSAATYAAMVRNVRDFF